MEKRRPLIEACVDSHASAAAAYAGGADRLELCANLSIGGTTPSEALFRQVRRDFDVPVNVLIRPRFGDFLYDGAELEEMAEEITRFRALGADGVVLGVLTPEGALDGAQLAPLLDRAGPLKHTLHRAFDMARDPFTALEEAIRLGFDTVLTSGQAPTAAEGKELLGRLNAQAAGRIHIMAGCGVRPENILEIFAASGVLIYHTSAARSYDSGMVFRQPGVSMGLPSLSEYTLRRTDAEAFRACARLVHRLNGAGDGK